MEQRYNLPFRNSPVGTASQHQVWQTPVYPSYAAVSPQQHQYYQSLPSHLASSTLHSQASSLPLGGDSATDQYGQFLQHHSSPPQGQVPNKSLSIYPPAPFPVGSVPLPQSNANLVNNNALLIPDPSHILRSQDRPFQGTCLACGQKDCHLSSHLYFSRQALAKLHKQHDRDRTELTPRASKVVPVPMQLTTPAMVQETERDHLLSLWTKEWSPIRLGPERHLFPHNYIDRLLPTAKRHGPLLQAVLAYSGTFWASANNVLGDLALRQQAVAVEVLSQACPSEQEASTDEAMMAATLLLLVYMEQGNDFEVSKHIAGLEHLVKLRGGVYYLGLGGVLAETLLHADHMQAIFFNQNPVWRVIVPALDIGLPVKMGNGFRQTQEGPTLDVQILLAARSVCRVADVFEGAIGKGIPKEARNAFSYLSMMATYQLAQCNAVHHASATVNECVCLVLILFNHVILCNQGSISPSTLRIEYRFWTALQAAEQKGLVLSMLPCLYMWMVLMGMTVAIRRESSYRILGVEKLRAARIAAGISSWDQLKVNVLDEYVWLAGAQEETFQRIWKEVIGLPAKRTNGNGL